MDLKYITGPITKADAGGLTAVISTPTVDKDGESVDPRGLRNREAWLSNPLVYWAHEWTMNPSAEPIGKGTSLDVSRDRIVSSAVFAPTPKAQNVRALVQGGFVRKTSIGFDPVEMRTVQGVPTHTVWDLREWSIVPMPANNEADVTGVKSALLWFADQIVEPRGETANGLTVTMAPRHVDGLLRKAADSELDLWIEEGAVTVRDRKRVIARIRRRGYLPLEKR